MSAGKIALIAAGVALGGCILLGVLGILLGVVTIESGPTSEQAFQPHLEAFLAPPTSDEAGGGEGYISGRAVVIDRRARALEKSQIWLPDEIRARRPEDVGTVIWLEWGEAAGATYVRRSDPAGPRSKSYVGTCDVTVIDWARRTIVGRARIVGEQADEIKIRADLEAPTIRDEAPLAKVHDFIRRLPRR